MSGNDTTEARDGGTPAVAETADPDTAAGGGDTPATQGDLESGDPGVRADAADPVADSTSDTEVHPTVDGEGDDRWDRYAPPTPVVAGRARRVSIGVGGAVWRFLSHEWTLAALGSLALAVLMTWPTLQHPTSTIPQDIWDPTLQAWQLSWAGHALLHDPTQLWNGNAFFPDKYSYAFSDTLLGYAPLGMIGTGPEAAIIRYNILFVLIYALSFFGTYALARQLGSGRTGATVAGAAVAFSPWRLGQTGHLHVLSIGGMALALAMLARGHGFSLRDGYRPELARWGWVVAGWVVAAWQLTIGFGIGLPFAYVVAAICVVSLVLYVVKRLWFWPVRKPFPLKLWLANIGGGLVFVAVAAFMAYPYLQVLHLHPEANRGEDLLALFSPPLNGFFIAPPESVMWGDAYVQARAALPWAPEMALLPGFFLYGLAVAGMFVSTWRLRHRIYLALGVVVSIALAMGTSGPDHGKLGYLVLYHALPGFNGIRTPGRLVLWTTFLLALLAAGAVGAFTSRAVELRTELGVVHEERPSAGPWLRLASLIPLVLVLAEGWNWNVDGTLGGGTPHADVPTSPVAMSTVQGPAMVLPSDQLTDMNVMLWSTDGFPEIVNGGSGFQPTKQTEIRNQMTSFPDQQSVQVLHTLGIRTVIVIRSRIPGTPYANAAQAPIDGLGLTRVEQGDAVIYTVK